MQVIRCIKHPRYHCHQIAEVWNPEWCEKVGWTFDDHYRPSESELAFAFDDDVECAVGWCIHENGVPMPPDVKVLEHVQDDKWDEIGRSYDDFVETGTTMTSAGYPLQIGDSHVAKFDGAIRFAQGVGYPTIYITDANDVTHYEVPVEEAEKLLYEVMGAAMMAHQKKQALRAQVLAATTIEEVEAIHW